MQLDVVVARARLRGVDALVMVVHGDRERFLRAVLADDVLVQDVVDLFRLRDIAKPEILIDVLVELFFDDLVAELDALVADVDARSGDELAHLLLRFAAEAALELVFLVAESEQAVVSFRRAALGVLHTTWSVYEVDFGAA